MNLHRMLLARAAENKPLRIGLIGAGKFGAMYLSQIPTTPGIHLLGIADLSPPRARENLARLGWKPEVTSAGSFAEARAQRQHLSSPTTGARWSAIPRSTSWSNRPAIRSPPSSMRSKPSATARAW